LQDLHRQSCNNLLWKMEEGHVTIILVLIVCLCPLNTVRKAI